MFNTSVKAFVLTSLIPFSAFSQLRTRKLNREESNFIKSDTQDPWKIELFKRLGRIREVCGELCSIETLDDFKRKANDVNGYPTFTADVDCDKLMGSDDVDASDFTFPTDIPEELVPYYTLNGLIPIKPHPRHFQDAYLGKEARSNIWSREDIDEKIKQAKEGILKGTYNSAGYTIELKNRLAALDLKGKHVLVIGSEDPWVEAICLALGVSKVTTLEYGKILSLHPQIETLTPQAFREMFMKKALSSFDGVVSISSLEHSGLGRYGDALNPWGDLIATGRAWCVTKSNGFLLLGLPGGSDDNIRYNAHRMYGQYRWPLITTNWEVQKLEMNKNYLKEPNGRNTMHSFKKIDMVPQLSNNNALVTTNSNVLQNESWKQELLERLSRVREVCGELCSVETLDDFKRKAVNINGYPTFTANINCAGLMGSNDIDASDFTFPTEIPKELVPFYTLNGLIPIKPHPRHFQDAYLGKEALTSVWTKEDIDEKIKLASQGILKGTYNSADLTVDLKNKLAALVLVGKHILVIGSEDPWVEATCLALGALKVTTLEYGSIESQHPQIETLTPQAFREMYFASKLSNFDGVVSISSLEHSGLGRYGDALNPWGDLIATGRAWCVTKPNGFLLLGLPGGSEDNIRYNAHRMYGKYRWPLITTNWEVQQQLEMNKDYLKEPNGRNTMHSFKKNEVDPNQIVAKIVGI